MTVPLCIRQGSKRNDDSVSVEELDWSAESQVLIPADHLWCDFKCRPWDKNSSSAVVRLVGCTVKFSETPLETAYGREMNWIHGQQLWWTFLQSACQLHAPSKLATSVALCCVIYICAFCVHRKSLRSLSSAHEKWGQTLCVAFIIFSISLIYVH